MAFDSKNTILLEKKYLYVRASLGFQLEGTSREIIPTNNGFYRFYVDNLSKALGNSYVNILYNSSDLTFQSFCSDLYMDELMSSDSSAIEDVVAELRNNTLKIEEFESGVSSAFESNHVDNVAITTSVQGLSKNFLPTLFTSNLPLITQYLSDSLITVDDSFFSLFKYGFSERNSRKYFFYNLSVKVLSQFGKLSGHSGYFDVGFIFNFKFPFSGSLDGGDSVTDKLSILFLSTDSISTGGGILTSSNYWAFKTTMSLETLENERYFIYGLNINSVLFQRISSLCGFSTPKQNFFISEKNSEGYSNISGRVEKFNNLIPCDLGFHDLSKSYKGWFSVCFSNCTESDLNFIKNCDFIFSYTSGLTSTVHLYDCSPFLKDGSIVLNNFALYESSSTGDCLCGVNLVYTGVSSAPSP